MNKIVVNTDVVTELRSKAKTLNDAIGTIFESQLKERRENDERVKNLSNLEIAMLDAGINRRTATVDTFIKNATTFTTQGTGADDLLFPAWTDTRVREAIEKLDVMQYVIASPSIPVEGGVTKGFTLDPYSEPNKKQLRKARVAEGADIPASKIKGGEITVNLYKLASRIETTYEALRRMRIPLYEKALDYLARDIVNQELDQVVQVLIKGTGNEDAAEEVLTTASADVITNDELASAVFKYFIKNNIAPTTLIVGEKMGEKIAGLVFDKNLVIGANERVKISVPQLGDVTLTVIIADVPQVGSKNVAILYNNEITVDKYVEVGSMINETQSNIINQTNNITASENVGFGIFLKGSNMIIKSA